MNKYVSLVLEDRAKLIKERDAAMAPYNAKIAEANKALAALGYKEGSAQHYSGSFTVKHMPTIKERVSKALSDEYPEGAHYSAILDYLNKHWPDLPVKRTSLSPQLTRLRKKDRLIELDEDKGIWRLVDSSKHRPKTTEAPQGASEGRFGDRLDD